LTLGLALADTASAEDLAWFTQPAGEGGIELIYGTPDSGYAPISFRCDRPGTPLTVVIEHEPASAEDGVVVEILLSAGDIEVPLATTGTRLLMDDLFILQGETPLDARLQDLLTSRGPLILTIEGDRQDYPLYDAAEAVRAMLDTCKTG
jgi:hypothetical protein